MYISSFPTLSFAQLISFQRNSLNPQIFPKDRSFFYFRGANAVYQAVKYLHIGVNDNVLMPSYHCGVEVEAVLKAKTNVRFFKIKENLEIDLADLESRIDQDTKAVFIIHYFGFPQKIDALKKLCQKYKIFLIEDCAHALYSKQQGQYLGGWGDVSIFSLQKSLAVPDGGALVIHQTKGIWKEQFSYPNALSTFRGATLLRLEHIRMFYPIFYAMIDFLLVKPARGVLRSLKRSGSRTFQINVPSSARFDISQSSKSISYFSKKIADSIDEREMVKIRRLNYKNLADQLTECREVKILFPMIDAETCPLFLPVVVNDRNVLKDRLERKGIKTFIFGEYLHAQLEKGFDPIAEKYSDKILCLPIHQDLRGKQINYLAQMFKESLT